MDGSMLHHLILDDQFEISREGCSYIAKMVEAGADMLVGGSSGLFRKDVPLAQAINEMHQQINLGLEKRNPTNDLRSNVWVIN